MRVPHPPLLWWMVSVSVSVSVFAATSLEVLQVRHSREPQYPQQVESALFLLEHGVCVVAQFRLFLRRTQNISTSPPTQRPNPGCLPVGPVVSSEVIHHLLCLTGADLRKVAATPADKVPSFSEGERTRA